MTIEGDESQLSYSADGFAGILSGHVTFNNESMSDVKFGTGDSGALGDPGKLFINTTGNMIDSLPELPDLPAGK